MNCGVYVLEWIKFRLLSAVGHRERLEDEAGKSFLREEMRETSMAVFDWQYIEKARMLIADFALKEMKRLQALQEAPKG